MLQLDDYIRMYKCPIHWYETKEVNNIIEKFKHKLIIKEECGYIRNHLISMPLARFAHFLGYNINLDKHFQHLLQQDYKYLSV